ncbi:tetratricopeptide repeat protein [Lysobacter silvisoli]|uniref:Tetratricopeptide repeat protein n=1 Tax=Lysobacter silvisoli TaxID=2293254 RepID=A0A371JZ39_9GAMM|nr:tetratricopeptide repeat protein [Lysobacter silvisoli]RDZ26945.1 hypothetical protein DX914_11765 [Lysobacter silvisoli]
MKFRWALPLSLAVVCAACVSAPPAPEPAYDAETAVKAIRQSAAATRELDVQPLRDNRVEDLRQSASALEKQGKYAEAAATLDQALAINAGDPALLQERAETALLLRKLDDAERYAKQAFDGGSKVGPLCRRHWSTIAAVRQHRLDVLKTTPVYKEELPAASANISRIGKDVAAARAQVEACTVSAPPRY